MRYDSIVIGAGLSGLTSALLLARSGRKVVVLEQHPLPAPVVRGFKRDRLYFDSGLHYVGGLGPGGAFRPLLSHLGVLDTLQLFPFAANGFDRLRIAATGETFSLPVGFAAIAQALRDRFPAAGTAVDEYCNGIENSWQRFPYLDLDIAIADFPMESVHGQTLAERLQVFADFPELQSLLSMHSLLYGVDPTEASTTLNAQVAGSYYHSAHGIVGGGKALVDALLGLLAAAGGEVRCGARVTKLVTDGQGVCGVRLADGEEFTAREVLATINPTLLPQLLPERVLRPAYVKRLRNLRQTTSAYILFARSSVAADLQSSNLFVQQRAGLFSSATDRPLEERSFYLTATGGAATEDASAVVGIVPAGFSEVAEFAGAAQRQSSAYAALKNSLSERLRQMFLAGCPDLVELDVLDLATPLTLRDYSLAPDGAIYGVGRFVGQYNPHPVTRLPGLFLSGQAIAAPGLLGAVVAAYLTCGTILGHDNLRKEIKTCR